MVELQEIHDECLSKCRMLNWLHSRRPHQADAIIYATVEDATEAMPSTTLHVRTNCVRWKCEKDVKNFLPLIIPASILVELFWSIVVGAISQVVVEYIMDWWHKKHPISGPSGSTFSGEAAAFDGTAVFVQQLHVAAEEALTPLLAEK